MKNKKHIESKKLNIFDRARLKMMMPNLDKYKKKYSDKNDFEEKYVVMSKEEFNLVQKLGRNLESHLTQIKLNNREIRDLKETNKGMVFLIKNTLEQLKQKEKQRRKTAGKVGGLTASLNKEKEKSEQLLEHKLELENTIEIQREELKLKEQEINILRTRGEKQDVEAYKTFFQSRRELERRKRENAKKISKGEKK